MNAPYSTPGRKRRRIRPQHLVWMIPLGLVLAVGIFIGLGLLVAWLWRVTLVDIFAIKPISFWQAWGIILLAQILFKANVHSRARTGRWRRCDSASDEAPQTGPREAT